MTNLRTVSKEELKSNLERLVRSERKITALVLEHIAEVDRRKLYLEWNHESLFAYLTQELKYSESAAYRRVQGARALLVTPEIKADLENGSLNLTQLSLAQTSIRQEEKVLGCKVSTEQRREILNDLKDKNLRETQRALDAKLPEKSINCSVTLIEEKHKRDESVELTLRLPKELFDQLKHIKSLYSHIIPNGDWCKVLELIAKDVVQKRDPRHQPKKNRTAKPQSENSQTAEPKPKSTSATVKRHVIPKPIRRFIFQRDEGRCQHRNHDGRKCGSQFQIEVDHVTPLFAGGSDELANLRLLCRVHNQARYRRGANIRNLNP